MCDKSTLPPTNVGVLPGTTSSFNCVFSGAPKSFDKPGWGTAENFVSGQTSFKCLNAHEWEADFTAYYLEGIYLRSPA